MGMPGAFAAEQASVSMRCPRRDEVEVSPFAGPQDHYQAGACSYCGSLDPATFMSRLEAGTIQLGSTDKSYKVYAHNSGGEPFLQTYRNCPRAQPCQGPDQCSHWVTREIDVAKFYFQHLDQNQRGRFVELLNANRANFVRGLGFYVQPFFCKAGEK